MIQIIVLLKIADKITFHNFESQAIRIMKKYNGSLISAFEPSKKESTNKNFDEVHILQFPSMISFETYRVDKELIELKQLRDKAISNTEIIVSNKFKNYD